MKSTEMMKHFRFCFQNKVKVGLDYFLGSRSYSKRKEERRRHVPNSVRHTDKQKELKVQCQTEGI